jgi:putative transcriptional regulator
MIKICLYDLLQSRGMTQRELHEESGVREGTISDMCNNESKMLGVRSLDRICKALDCKIGDIIEFIPDGDDF